MTPSDGIADAARWLDHQLGGRPLPPLLVVIGLGHGYLLEVLEHRGFGTRVLALEPDPAVGHSFLVRRDWAAWREAGCLAHLVGPDYAGADDAWRMFPSKPEDHVLLVDPVVARDHRDAALAAARLAKRIVFGAQANADARRRFAPRYLTNTLRNAPAMTAGSDVRALTDFYRGVPAVIAAAGPSLDCALDDLREFSDRAVLIGVDTALRPLLDVGVRPALAIGMDPSAKNARHFRSLPDCSETWLVAETALDPVAAGAFEDRTFWFRVADHHPWPWFRELGIDVGRIDVWGSVLTAAFQVAILAGCDPIVLVGADLACTDGRPYARGTTYEFDWAYSAALGAGLEHAWRMQVGMFEQLRVPDLRGAETITTPPLQAFRDWMVAQASRCGRRVVNATGAGILFGRGIEQSSLRAALPSRREIPSLRSVQPRWPSSVSRATLAAQFRELQQHAIERSMAPIAQWAEFTGDGFDPSAIEGAIDAAAAIFESPAADGIHPGRRRSADSQPSGFVRQLPEGIARLRAALHDVRPMPAPSLPSQGPHDELATLRRALGLLASLRCALEEFAEDDAAPLARHGTGRTTVAGLCAWPEEIAWPMALFEGLLGRTFASSWPVAGDSFFSRAVVCRPITPGMGGADASRGRSDASQAADRLALEWLICASRLHQWPASAFARLRGLLLAAETGDRRSGTPGQAGEIDFVLGDHATGEVRTVNLPITPDQPSLARALCGLVTLSSAASESELVTSGTDGVHGKTLCVRAPRAFAAAAGNPVTIVARTSGADGNFCESLLLTPRVLTDEGVSRSILGYSTSGGAVFVPLLGRESFLVRHDGSMDVHRSWPRPIIGELPLGIDGAVAWNNWPETGPSYVMHRSSAGDTPEIQDLPFKPTIGAWWGSRLYWSGFPAGIGSWAPGEDAALSFPEVTLLSIHPDETGLVLAPCVRDEGGTPQRQRFTEGWRWRPGAELEAVRLGLNGASSSRASNAGWTAVAFPDADVVQLVSDRGIAIAMTCYYPFTVAWADSSLLVSTIEGELLLFEDLADELGHWVQALTGL